MSDLKWKVHEEYVEPTRWEDDGVYLRGYGLSASGEEVCVAIINKAASAKLQLYRETKDNETSDRKDHGGPHGRARP